MSNPVQDKLRDATMSCGRALLVTQRLEFAKHWDRFLWRTLPPLRLEDEPGVQYFITVERNTEDHRLLLDRIIAELKAGRIIEAQTIAEEAL